ncbi:MAG: carotenoid oxygenase family protein [Chloroflexi bacterium]|nr:carotenoid oxygenase family protein [Chloroflexota bacterium]
MGNRFKHGFTTVADDVTHADLRVEGQIPAWLTGTLIRNGPGQFEVNGHSYRHWFDGLALLHSFTFADGRVSYRGRYLRSAAYLRDNATGRINYRGFAVDPCRSLFQRVMSLFVLPPPGHNAAIHITRVADRFLALTETPIPVAFDPHTLETLGVYDYGDALSGQVTTAHPHFDAQRGIAINYLLKFGFTQTYQIYGISGARRHLMARIPAPRPAYMHSFAMTARYVILAEFSLVLPVAIDVLLSGKPFIENYRWQPERPARFLVIDKDTGARAATVEAEPFFAFHHVNAFERDSDLILDIAAYHDARVIDHLRLDHLRGDQPSLDWGELRRYRVPLDGRSATYEIITDLPFDLPQIDYPRRAGQPYRVVYGAGSHPQDRDFINQLIRVEVESGAVKTWYEPGCYPSEPVFVPKPGATEPDDGLILAVVLDGARESSFLLILDAATFTEIGRAHVPRVIPFSFHGTFFADI